jgi:hypothetical protein
MKKQGATKQQGKPKQQNKLRNNQQKQKWGPSICLAFFSIHGM